MRYLLHIIAFTFLLTGLHAKNLIKNGDFERGLSAWDTDFKVKKDKAEGNRYLMMHLKENDLVHVFQDFKNGRHTGDYTLTFDYKTSEDFLSNGGFQIWLYCPPQKNVKYSTPLKASPEKWSKATVTVTHTAEHKEKRFVLSIHGGTGTIQIDNIELRPGR